MTIFTRLARFAALLSLGWVAGAWAGAHFARTQFALTRQHSFVIATLALLLSLMFLIPIRQTFRQASRARALARIWDLHDAETRARVTNGENNLTVPVSYNIGGTDVLTGDPKWYVNHCFAVFYSADTVTAFPGREGLKIMLG